ncbi:hypothetical protein HDU77_001183 [Chytriomyces hyalinus]|nr:hypothetical protein HDU77_001183 [Chytriomyces hyalinus]
MSQEDSDSDSEVALPADTLAMLQSFLAEKQEAEQRFAALRETAHADADSAAARRKIEVSMDDFTEDWQLSQFWYDKTTAVHLATHSVAVTPSAGKLACVSSPTVFVELMKHAELADAVDPYVFEFDSRFSVFGSAFVFFDFNHPTTFDTLNDTRPLQAQFDTLVVDPPFLSDECWTKTSECVRWLAKKDSCKIIVCTGLVMRAKIEKELGCKLTSFEPKHKGGLSNEFGCFTNFESEGFRWVE